LAEILMKILIVDDNPKLRLLYQEEFGEDGYQVVVAENGKQALEMLTHMPDIVILDIMMPGMDGIELLGRILARNKKIKVLMNTAFSNFKDNFMTWPADAYVVKSGDLEELKRKVRELAGIAIAQA